MAKIKEFILLKIVIPIVDMMMGMKISYWFESYPAGTELSRMGDVELSMPSPMPFGPDGHRHAEQDSGDAYEEPDRR